MRLNTVSYDAVCGANQFTATFNASKYKLLMNHIPPVYDTTRKLNKAIAGYHLLMILSQLDGDFDVAEGEVVVNYLKETFPFHVDLDNEIDFLCTLPQDKYMAHFGKAMNDFYEDSTPEERTNFLDFAVQIVTADHELTKDENVYLSALFNAWDPEHEEE